MKTKQIMITCLFIIYIFSALVQSGHSHASDLIKVKSNGIQPINITRDRRLKNKTEIEASGLIYLEDIQRYMVISDETPDNKPVLYLMDKNGRVDQEVSISGLARINDMEAVCRGDNRDFYIICSQSLNKKSRISNDRKLFIRIEQKEMNFYLKDSILLYDRLFNALNDSNNPELKWIKPPKKRSLDIDIEGLFFHQGAIFLGLKKPLRKNQAVILKINNINKVLKENRLHPNDIIPWRFLELKDIETGVYTGISDLHLNENSLFVLSQTKIKKSSHLRISDLKRVGKLWKYDLNSNLLSLIKTFKNRQTEGIALRIQSHGHDADNLKIVGIVCDCGKDRASQFMELSLDRSP